MPLLRVLVLGLFALGLVLQPVMAAAGEMHELVHNPSGTHAHDLHADELAGDMVTPGEPEEGGAKILHVLLHFAHCCGAATALVPVLEPSPSMPASSRLAIDKAPVPPATHLPSPFKPPIFM